MLWQKAKIKVNPNPKDTVTTECWVQAQPPQQVRTISIHDKMVTLCPVYETNILAKHPITGRLKPACVIQKETELLGEFLDDTTDEIPKIFWDDVVREYSKEET